MGVNKVLFVGTLFSLLFILMSPLALAQNEALKISNVKVFDYSFVNKDGNYSIENITISYKDNLTITFDMGTNYSTGYTPSDAYVGLSAGVNLAGKTKLYVWNGTDWVDRTSNIEYLAQRTIHGKTYEDIYYYAFGTLPDDWGKTVKIEVNATKQQIRNYIISDNNLIAYFGEGSSILKVIENTNIEISNAYYNMIWDTTGCAIQKFTDITPNGGKEWVQSPTSLCHLRVVCNITDPLFAGNVEAHTTSILEQSDVHIRLKCGSGTEWVYADCYEDFPYCFFNYSVTQRCYVANYLTLGQLDTYSLGTNHTGIANASGSVYNQVDRGFASANISTVNRSMSFLFDSNAPGGYGMAFTQFDSDGTNPAIIMGRKTGALHSANIDFSLWYGLSAPSDGNREALNDTIMYIESTMNVVNTDGSCKEQSNGTIIFDCNTNSSNFLTTQIVQNNTNISDVYVKVRFNSNLTNGQLYVYNNTDGIFDETDFYVGINDTGTFDANGVSIADTNADNYTDLYVASNSVDAFVGMFNFGSDVYVQIRPNKIEAPPVNTTPVVSLYNVTGSTTDTTPSIDFNYTDDDLSSTCYLYFNDTAYDSNNAVQNATRTTLTANTTLSIDDYEVKVSCNDGINTGTSGSIILTITTPPSFPITITFPENKTYSSLTIPLSVIFGGIYATDTVIYELNLINITVYPNTTENDDTEDAYGCFGTFNDGFECSNAVDEDWDTGSVGFNAIVYENYTIPSYITSANWTNRYSSGVSCSYTGVPVYYWNYTLGGWQILATFDCPEGNYTNSIPSDGLTGNVLQIKTEMRYGFTLNWVKYKEGMIVWSSNLPSEIIAQDGSNNLIVWANNTQGISNSSQVVFSVTISPSIDEVNVPSVSLDPVEKSTTNVAINFTATGTYLDNSSAKFVLSKGVTSYTDTVCEVTAIDSNTNRYDCDVNLNYYDSAGVWTVNVSIDNSTADGLVYDDSETITYNSLTALQTNSSSLSFSTFNRASSSFIDTNQLENTGNVNLTTITVTGYDLRGVTDTNQFLYLSDSVFAVRQEGESYSDLINSTGVTVTNGVIDLYPSQYSNLDFKITPANIPATNKAQVYQTETGLKWVISV